ncbi:MAG: hypothetical protein WAZ77_11350 [Candidatus Nitrosopolaris sp.]
MKLTRLLLIAPVVVSILTMIGATTTHVALADPQHCDQSGWPSLL